MSKIKDTAPIQHLNDQLKMVVDKAKSVRAHADKMLTKWVDYASSDWLEKMDALVLKIQKPLIALDEKIDELDASLERSMKSRRQLKKRKKEEECDMGRFVSEGGAQTTVLADAGQSNSATLSNTVRNPAPQQPPHESL